jgi:chromosome segregation ATPase
MLAGQFLKLGETLKQLNASNRNTQTDLQAAAAAISGIAQDTLEMRRYTQEVFAQMDAYLQRAQRAGEAAEAGGERAEKLLEDLRDAAMAQAQYAERMQAYQAELHGSVQQYTQWAGRLFEQTESQGKAVNESLARVSAELQDSATLLQSSYESFVENIQLGLSRALSMLDENIGGIAAGLNTTASGMRATVAELPGLMAGSARKYGAQVDQFVGALSQLQRSMQGAAEALERQAERGGVV